MIFHYLSQNESVILKMDSHVSYDCRDIGRFLEVTLEWIHPIHQNLCRTGWQRVGNNVDSRNNRFVYGYAQGDTQQIHIRGGGSVQEIFRQPKNIT